MVADQLRCLSQHDLGGQGRCGERVGLEASAVAEVAEGAAESVGEWLGGLVPG